MYSLFCCKELNTFPLYNGGRYENKSSSENTHANPGKTIEPKQTMAGKMTIDDVVRKSRKGISFLSPKSLNLSCL